MNENVLEKILKHRAPFILFSSFGRVSLILVFFVKRCVFATVQVTRGFHRFVRPAAGLDLKKPNGQNRVRKKLW